MLNHDTSLDLAFQALADGSRHAMLVWLVCGPASVSELARPLDISLPAVMQYLTALESPDLVRSERVDRVRTCRIEPGALSLTEQWISQRRLKWEQHFDRFGAYLETLKTQGDIHDDDR